MADYALVSGDLVVNVIVAESQEVAESLTGLVAVAVVDDAPGMGWTLTDGEWRPPAPFASWLWSNGSWEAPKPIPQDERPYYWDEALGDWVPLDVADPE